MSGGSRKRRHHSKPGPRLDPTRLGLRRRQENQRQEAPCPGRHARSAAVRHRACRRHPGPRRRRDADERAVRPVSIPSEAVCRQRRQGLIQQGLKRVRDQINVEIVKRLRSADRCRTGRSHRPSHVPFRSETVSLRQRRRASMSKEKRLAGGLPLVGILVAALAFSAICLRIDGRGRRCHGRSPGVGSLRWGASALDFRGGMVHHALLLQFREGLSDRQEPLRRSGPGSIGSICSPWTWPMPASTTPCSARVPQPVAGRGCQ